MYLNIPSCDEVSEWLRSWTANQMGSARVGSNPILVDVLEMKLSLRPSDNIYTLSAQNVADIIIFRLEALCVLQKHFLITGFMFGMC